MDPISVALVTRAIVYLRHRLGPCAADFLLINITMLPDAIALELEQMLILEVPILPPVLEGEKLTLPDIDEKDMLEAQPFGCILDRHHHFDPFGVEWRTQYISRG